MTEPLLTNERAQREWAWLVERFGRDACQRAIAELQGGQRAFPLNIARRLGATLPEDLAAAPTPREQAQLHLDGLKALLRPVKGR